jgi:glycosyltransferase involved in cell wall biosynthesis
MSSQLAEHTSSSINLLFFGAVLPESHRQSAAFSRAGNMWITNLLRSLAAAGLAPQQVLSFEPVPAFPRSRVIWVRGKRDMIAEIPVRLFPFLNLPILKLLHIGIQAFFFVIFSHWGHRREERWLPVACCYNASFPFGPFVWLATRLTKNAALVTLNDVFVPGGLVPDNFVRRIDFAVMKRLVPRFDGFIAVTDRIMRELAPGRPYIRVEGGVPEELLQPREARRKKSDKEFVIGVAGSLTEANGVLEILDAFEKLQGDRWKLRIAGTGPLKDIVDDRTKRDPRMEWLGAIPFSAVVDFYADADLLINMRLTKRIKSDFFFPSKLMEYLASGTPVITTCTGHTEEEYSTLAFMLRDESSDALANLIREVANKSANERLELGARARAYMCSQKSWRAQGRRVADHIRVVARSRKHRVATKY